MNSYGTVDWVFLVISTIIAFIFLWSFFNKNKHTENVSTINVPPFFQDKKREQKLATQFCLKKSLTWAFVGSCCFFFRLLLDYIDPYGLGMIFFIFGIFILATACLWLLKALVVNF